MQCRVVVMKAYMCLQDSLMCLPLKLSQSLGNISQLVLCHRITSLVHLVDPQTTQSEDLRVCQFIHHFYVAVELTSQVFWRMPFVSLCEQQQLVEFFVVQIEPTSIVNNKVSDHMCFMWYKIFLTSFYWLIVG